MNDAQARGDWPTPPNGRDGHPPSAFWLSRIWRDFEPRRGTLFLINIGLPILIGMARGETRGALIGCIMGATLVLVFTALGFPAETRSLFGVAVRKDQ
jgi:hypothetical protein